MKELSLFTGAGGGVWASKLLGHQVIGYVEHNEYCQKVIKARIDDGSFDRAPIFTDVREFVQSGAARQYRGFADVVSGGFPCQPFSVAGKQAGADDERDMWPATRDVICDIRPRVAFLENVPGLLASGYFGTILADLAGLGYDARWCCLSCEDVGGVHRRKRAWIYAADKRSNGAQGHIPRTLPRFGGLPWGEDVRGAEDVRDRSSLPEPLIRRIGHDVAYGRERLNAVGNGQVPRVAATAFRMLESA